MSVSSQVCRVVESEPTSRKILIELNGKLVKTEKLLGIDLRPGDFACYQTYNESNKTLVVALHPDEISELKKRNKSYINEGVPENQFVTLENAIASDDGNAVEKIFGIDFKNISKALDKDRIKDPLILEKINAIFESIVEEVADKNIRDVFPVVAIQTSEEFFELKNKIYQKADEMLCRKLVNSQTNREVHQYLMDKIDRITNESEHKDFFKSLGYYLSRLKKIQVEKNLSSSKMGVIFYPIYSYYVQRFKKETIDSWIDLRVDKGHF
jgi:hypothetical protein